MSGGRSKPWMVSVKLTANEDVVEAYVGFSTSSAHICRLAINRLRKDRLEGRDVTLASGWYFTTTIQRISTKEANQWTGKRL